jgi:hypothetical protein
MDWQTELDEIHTEVFRALRENRTPTAIRLGREQMAARQQAGDTQDPLMVTVDLAEPDFRHVPGGAYPRPDVRTVRLSIQPVDQGNCRDLVTRDA